MKTTLVLDACAMIAFLNDEPGADVVEELLVKARQNDIELIINAINALEIYYDVYRTDGAGMADKTLEKIRNLPIKIVHAISEEVFREAGKLKATCKISLADAVALAEANVRHTQIVTADHHEFDELEKETG
jgi:predicted nucleic acid-binding protein